MVEHFLTRYSQINSVLTQKRNNGGNKKLGVGWATTKGCSILKGNHKGLPLQNLIPISFNGIYKYPDGFQIKVRIQSVAQVDDVFGAEVLHHL